MKVLDLRCANEHAFEGWFGSEEDFQNQRVQGRLQCPSCGTLQVRKVLSAPRLNLGAAGTAAAAAVEAAQDGAALKKASVPGSAHQKEEGAVGASSGDSRFPRGAVVPFPAGRPSGLEAAWWHWAREAVAQADDVGSRFADEARRMHQGDAPERAIHGQATVRETLELLEDGIAVLPLPSSVTDKLH